ncbi:MAG: nuclear transport factor 2 family protein [Myxococcota bacterium]
MRNPQDDEQRSREGPRARHPNAAIARRFWEAASRGDGDGLRELMAPDVVWRAYGAGALTGEFRGCEAVIARLAGAGDIVDGLRSTLLDVYAGDRGAVLHYGVEAQRGSQQIEMERLLVCRILAGRIVQALSVVIGADDDTLPPRGH